MLENMELTVTKGYIDSNDKIDSYNGLKCFRPEEINKETDFIFFALLNRYDEIDELLARKGFSEELDYTYVFKSKEISIKKCSGHYCDVYGNEIQGNVDGFEINFVGFNNFVYIGDNCKIDESINITCDNNSVIIISDNCILERNAIISARNNSVVKLSRNFSAGFNFVLTAIGNSCCYIGNDCMLSHNIRFQVSDNHNIYDMDKKENINKNKDYSIIINNHVWIGEGSKILYGTNIGSGSIVGMNTFVNKKFPNNVVIAGNPAKIVRENVAWIRRKYSFIDDYEEFKEFDFMDKIDIDNMM